MPVTCPSRHCGHGAANQWKENGITPMALPLLGSAACNVRAAPIMKHWEAISSPALFQAAVTLDRDGERIVTEVVAGARNDRNEHTLSDSSFRLHPNNPLQLA
jgi:hypothetical protein